MKRKGKIPGRYHKTLKEQVRENPRLAAVYVILRVLVVLALGYFFCLGVRGRKEGGEINFWASLLVLLAALLRLGELLEQ